MASKVILGQRPLPDSDRLCQTLGIPAEALDSICNTAELEVEFLIEDVNGHPIIVERQSDSDNLRHIAKIVSYLSATEASRVLWIVRHPDREVVQTVDWFNAHSDLEVFLLYPHTNESGETTLEVVDGPESVLPAEVQSRVEEGIKRKRHWRFWQGFASKARGRSLHGGSIAPTTQAWIKVASGIRNVRYAYIIQRDKSRVAIYFEHEDENENERFFDRVQKERKQIDKAFGEALVWDRMDGKKECRIECVRRKGGLEQEQKWDDIQNSMLDDMELLGESFKIYYREMERLHPTPFAPAEEPMQLPLLPKNPCPEKL